MAVIEENDPKPLLKKDEDISLLNYEEFRSKSKALSHFKVKRANKGGVEYFHHFLVISNTPVTDKLDAVRIGQYTTSGEIFTECNEGIGKFVQETFFLGEQQHDTILDFKNGVFLVDKSTYPETKESISEAFNRLKEITDERKYDLSLNNCEHSINYILTGESYSKQASIKTVSKRCVIDLCNVVLIDCKEVGLRTTLLVAALGAIAGSLVRRAYVNIIVAAIVSYSIGSQITDCGGIIGSNIRREAQHKIEDGKNLPDVNKVILDNKITILDNIKEHMHTDFVCRIAEKLIYDAALKTCCATLVVSVGMETVFFLFYLFFNLLSRRRRKTINNEQFCRVLFLHVYGGYLSIALSVVVGYFVFLWLDPPSLTFFGFVFGGCVFFRYLLTIIGGLCFDICCCSCWWGCFEYSCWSGCKSCCSYRCYRCDFSTVCFAATVLIIVTGIVCSLVFYFFK